MGRSRMAGFAPDLVGRARRTEPIHEVDKKRGLRSILFACNMNAVRSPMAAAIARHLADDDVRVESAGVKAGEVNGFAIAALAERDIDISAHEPKTFADLEETDFDLIVTMTPEAQHNAMELTRAHAAIVEFWPTIDPTVAEGRGSREQVMDVYRELRDQLWARIEDRLKDG
ncbi:MAG: low molecular weight phosphatase family protein [Alphaproteobacteria bacterium]